MPQPAPVIDSTILHEEGGFRYLNASDAASDGILRVLSESFAREPMARALGASTRDLASFVRRFMPECTRSGLSVVAVLDDDPHTVVGAFLSRDFKSPVPENILHDCPWFLPVALALMSIGEVYEARHPHLERGDAADLWMVGIDARFAMRGIASRMFRLCVRLARERGFSRCVTECTGHYSQRAARRARFEEITRLSHKEFRFQGKAVFAGIPLPHTHLAFCERKL
jgi:ribosomal protein S18 acetylase RimI-like enzyme